MTESGQYNIAKFKNSVSPRFDNPLTILKINTGTGITSPDENHILNMVDDKNIKASYIVISPSVEVSKSANSKFEKSDDVHIDT